MGRRLRLAPQENGSNRFGRRRFLAGLAALGGPAALAAPTRNKPKAIPSGRPGRAAASEALPRETGQDSLYFETCNGWYMQDGTVIWGYARNNEMWGGYRGKPTGWWTDYELGPSLIRNDPGQVGPNRTEDLDKLTDDMAHYGYPGWQHTPPLWYDRRRDSHVIDRRTDGNVVAPFLEMPWARTTQGQAWDGLPLYDLTKFNPWYFNRLKEFAEHCDRKRCVLFHDCYNQHNLLETQAHYCDYPWRPVNCVQATDLPDTNPVANVFYDVSHPLRRDLHQRYIRHCLDNLKTCRNVVFLTGAEYTGPASFVQFWFDTILDWEKQSGRRVHIGLGATRDVVDAILRDPRYGPRVGTIDMRYWFYTKDDTLHAPRGGQQVAGRYVGQADQMTPWQIYRLIREYRLLYPDKAIIHNIYADQKQTMAFLMAGGSMLVRTLDAVGEYPPKYEMPQGCEYVHTIYELIRTRFATDLSRLRPLDVVDHAEEDVWCLGDPGNSYLVYMLAGKPFKLDLSNAPGTFEAKWVGMRLGKIFDAAGGTLEGGKVQELHGPDWRQWMLWLKKRA